MNRIITLLILALSLTATQAQKRTAKQRGKAKATATVTSNPLDEKIAQMTESTQKIVFVDSIVVDKQAFIDSYTLSPEAGRIGRYDDLIRKDGQANAFAYINEIGDKCFYSMEDAVGNFGLFTANIIDGQTADGTAVDGIDVASTFRGANYPFMMSDGMTFYFAAKGNESIGGYDIFVTRYDAESASFLKPENIGMPFNSTANDYMYAIDEYANIGWFATDRRQDEGKVCIYMFIPPTTRETYATTDISEERLKGLADLRCIADTWGDANESEAAKERIKAVAERKEKETKKTDFTFVVNDNVTYHYYKDFQVAENATLFKQLQEKRSKLTTLEKELTEARNYYATASISDRSAMANELLQSEKNCENLEESITQTEKNIRNSENKALNN